MLKLWSTFRLGRQINMNTLNMSDRIRHEIPGKFYFFHVTEDITYLEIHLIYTYPKLYMFTRKELTYLSENVMIRNDGSI